MIFIKTIVLPGDLISEKPLRVENTFLENSKTYSKVLGIYDKTNNNIVPLEGSWIPHISDKVVGVVIRSRNTVYEVDLLHFTRSIMIGSKFDRHIFKAGEPIEAVIKDIESRKTIILEEAKSLYGGVVIRIKPTKIPRIIGKSNTMIKQITEATKSQVVVGMNGLIWIKGGNLALATEAILKIENEAHTSGLTERIKKMLYEQMVK